MAWYWWTVAVIGWLIVGVLVMCVYYFIDSFMEGKPSFTDIEYDAKPLVAGILFWPVVAAFIVVGVTLAGFSASICEACEYASKTGAKIKNRDTPGGPNET